MDRVQEILRTIPQVDQLLATGPISEAVRREGRDLVVRHIRAELESLRARIRDGRETVVEAEKIVQGVLNRLHREGRPGVRRVINATGIVLHTGLGRAVLAPSVIEAVRRELSGYSTLEIDPSTGERSIREAHVARFLCEITRAEAATVVNNNAGATLLALTALAAGREVILSRSQMIEIGGSFRMPDVMQQGGCRLVEVGTTNKTYPRDIEDAITPETALLLHVHTSNYRIEGFSRQVEVEEMVSIGRRHGIPVMDDVGSGLLADLSPWGIREEPTVQRSVRAGADVVCFSGDKLLGGPQAGILVGRRDLVQRIRRHPLFRALRPDKLALVALEATLRLYLNPDKVLQSIPVLRMLTLDAATLEARALDLARRLRKIKGLGVAIEDGASEAGGGSLPAHPLPTRLVAVSAEGMGPDALAQALRDGQPGIMTRVQRNRVLFDVRTLLAGEAEQIESALRRIVRG